MKEIIKARWIFWALFSYFIIFSFFYVFIIIPQKNLILKSKTEKELLEYNYLKIKGSPKFFQNVLHTVAIAEEKIKNFEWLNYDDDPNFAFYLYIENVAKDSGIEIISISQDEKSKEKENIYYLWDVKLMGNFPQLLSFIYNIEKGKKYLKIEEIEVTRGEENGNFYNLKIAGIKEVK